jgi:tetratricopeptide (TPR) repeat protein
VHAQIAKSDEFKARANKCFQDNKLNEAIELYISALELNPGNHILYANRAFCHIKLENYGVTSPPRPLASSPPRPSFVSHASGRIISTF